MHPDLLLLAELDRQDRTIDRIRADKQKADETVTGGRTRRDQAKANQKRIEDELAATEKVERETQRSIEKYEARRSSAQRVLEGGGGDPEAAERQVNAVTDILDDLETQVLESMEKIEALKADVQAAKNAVQAAKDTLEAANQAHPKTIAALKAEYAIAKQKRDAAFDDLDRSTQSKYEATRARKGRAISEIRDDTCHMCRRVVQPKHLADLSRGLIRTCDGCGRWLVFEQTG